MSRVLIVALTSYAGMGPYVSEIVNDFSPEDDVYFLFRDYDDDFYYKNIKKELHPKSVFVRIPNTSWNTLVDLIFNRNRLWKYIKRICKEQNINLVHFIYNPKNRLHKMGIGVVSTVHDLQPHEAKKEWYKMIRHRICSKRFKKSVESGDNFITNSKTQLVNLREWYPHKSIFYHSFPSLVTDIIKNGVDSPIELRDITKPYILFFGLIEAYKGVPLLYNVFLSTPEINQNYCLVIAGRGSVPHIINNPEKKILFINRYIADTEIAYLYRHAKVVVYPYISATQSGVLTLASFFGTPILASDVPFFMESIDNGVNGMLFRKGDENDLRKVLLTILNSDNKEISNNERVFYEKHYSKGVIKSELLDIYRQVSNH